MWICCRRDFAFGHGGPTLWPEQMRTMAERNLECGFDIYIGSDEVAPEPP